MTTVSQTFGVSRRTEDFGIEVELEAERLNLDNIRENYGDHWRDESDGSLRGEDSREFVSYILTKEAVPEALRDLEEAIDGSGSIIDMETERASVHIHINFTQNTIAEAITFCMIYYMFEQQLFNYAGDFRRDNFYCIPFDKCSTAPLDFLQQLARNPDEVPRVDPDAIRYAALNLAALRKYGTLEVRSLRSTYSHETILTWMEMLYQIKEAACRLGNPKKLFEAYSQLDCDSFVDEYFPRIRPHLSSNWYISYIEASCMVMPIAVTHYVDNSPAEETSEDVQEDSNVDSNIFITAEDYEEVILQLDRNGFFDNPEMRVPRHHSGLNIANRALDMRELLAEAPIFYDIDNLLQEDE